MNKLLLLQIIKEIEANGFEKAVKKYSKLHPKLDQLAKLVDTENLLMSDVLELLIMEQVSLPKKKGKV